MKKPAEKIIAHVDPDLRDLIPGYLENRQKDITTIKSRIDQAEKTFSKIAELYLSGIKRNQRYWIKPYIQED